MTLARRVAPWSRICSLVDTPSLVDAAFLIRDIVFDAVALRAPSGIGDLLRFDGEERGVRKERDPSLDILRWRSPAILSFGDLRLSSPGATPPPAETIFKGDKGCAGGATPPKLSGDTDAPFVRHRRSAAAIHLGAEAHRRAASTDGAASIPPLGHCTLPQLVA
eukprot:1468550-Prymnesium_polylepis.1